MGFHRIKVSTEGRPSTYAIRSGTAVPEKSELSHSTILQMANAASLSNCQVNTILPFVRKDVAVEPYAEKMLVEANRALNQFFTTTMVPMEVARTGMANLFPRHRPPNGCLQDKSQIVTQILEVHQPGPRPVAVPV